MAWDKAVSWWVDAQGTGMEEGKRRGRHAASAGCASSHREGWTSFANDPMGSTATIEKDRMDGGIDREGYEIK